MAMQYSLSDILKIVYKNQFAFNFKAGRKVYYF